MVSIALLSISAFASPTVCLAGWPAPAIAETHLQGGVVQNELTDEFERQGVTFILNAQHKLVVNTVHQGSAAFYAGLSPQDAILDIQPRGASLAITIQRDGKIYQINVETTTGKPLSAGVIRDFLKAAVGTNNLQLNSRLSKTGPNTPVLSTAINHGPGFKIGADDKILIQYDVQLIIDVSISMNDQDGTGNLSKFQWCHQQVRDLAKELEPFAQKISITTFNDQYSVYEKCGLEEVENIYATVQPGNVTCMVTPLMDRLMNARDRHKRTGRRTLIVMIGDGLPNCPYDPRTLEPALIDFSKTMDGPNDVKVLFLQIGDAFQGRDYFNNLDTNLVVKGAKYHIVETVPFNQLKQEGIVKALVSAVKDNATYVYIPTSNSASADNSQSLPAIAAPAYNGPRMHTYAARDSSGQTAEDADHALDLSRKARKELENRLLDK